MVTETFVWIISPVGGGAYSGEVEMADRVWRIN